MIQNLLLAACGLAVTAAAFADSPTTAASQPARLKVLFLGNSQMSVCDLPHMVQVMSESAAPDCPRIDSEKVMVGGASLKSHWNTRGKRIEDGHWDFVVIQELYNNDDPEFSTYAEKFDDVIRKSGAKTILFATASVTSDYSAKCSFPDSTRHLNDIQIAFGKKHDVAVAAGGLAWIRYLGTSPTHEQILDLYAKDKGHPGIKGSYINACVLYACITGRNPEGLTSEFKDIHGGITIDKDEALKMQRAAWAQYLENKK